MTETSAPSSPSMPTRGQFRFLHRLRVRWAEVDMQQIVFNGHYLMYVDTAMAGYWRALALPYQDTMLALGGDLYVRKATLEYEGSARYDDACDVGLRCVHIGNSSMRFQAAVFRGEQRLVHGELIYVFANPATQSAQPVPDALREVVLGFEAGQAMLDVQVQSGAGATEWQACARNRLGQMVASAQWQAVVGQAFQLDDLQVLPAVRGGGIGRAVLQQLLDHARQQGAREVQMHAPRTAVGFFTCVGFSVVGDALAAATTGSTTVAMRLRID